MPFTFNKDGYTKTCDGCGAVLDAGSGHICAAVKQAEKLVFRGETPEPIVVVREKNSK